VTFGASWRRFVIAICRTHLVAGAGSERVVSVSYPMGLRQLGYEIHPARCPYGTGD
jgi:hypothetical protein